jgi:1-acyl-sn-glycerol-3-phosphate acyltransferase
LEHLRNVTREGQILLLANHRSIFDFFVIIGAIIWQTSLPRRWFFPVRSNFAYDNLIGICVNLFMTGMSMFPPILYGRRGDMFNRYSLARTVEELATPGTLIGMHPEGMRSRTPNPYQLRPAQPGIGRVALEAKAARAFPVCVIGPTKGLLIEFWRNWMAPDVYPIHVLFGPEIDISDLRAQGSRPTTQKLAADRCLAAVASLVEMEQAVPKKDL